jgi:hypothetical protein
MRDRFFDRSESEKDHSSRFRARAVFTQPGSNAAVISGLRISLGLLYLSDPKLAMRVGTSCSCHNPDIPWVSQVLRSRSQAP